MLEAKSARKRSTLLRCRVLRWCHKNIQPVVWNWWTRKTRLTSEYSLSGRYIDREILEERLSKCLETSWQLTMGFPPQWCCSRTENLFLFQEIKKEISSKAVLVWWMKTPRCSYLTTSPWTIRWTHSLTHRQFLEGVIYMPWNTHPQKSIAKNKVDMKWIVGNQNTMSQWDGFLKPCSGGTVPNAFPPTDESVGNDSFCSPLPSSWNTVKRPSPESDMTCFLTTTHAVWFLFSETYSLLRVISTAFCAFNELRTCFFVTSDWGKMWDIRMWQLHVQIVNWETFLWCIGLSYYLITMLCWLRWRQE